MHLFTRNFVTSTAHRIMHHVEFNKMQVSFCHESNESASNEIHSFWEVTLVIQLYNVGTDIRVLDALKVQLFPKVLDVVRQEYKVKYKSFDL